MPNVSDVHRVVMDLHDKKIINADTSIGDLLSVKADHLTNPATLAGWYAVGGEHYVVVCGAKVDTASINPGPITMPSNINR